MSRRLLLASVLMLSSFASAEVTLPKILSDHMVIQRDLPVHVWGRANPGEQVSVTFRDETRTTTTNPLGHWNAYLKPGSAGGPFEMTVKSTSGSQAPLLIHDILVGDVWVASGQSNMEFEMRKASTAAADLPQAANPRIRLLIVKKRAATYPEENVTPRGGPPPRRRQRRNSPQSPGTSRARSSRPNTSQSV